MSSRRLFGKIDVYSVTERQKELFNQKLRELPAETILKMCKEFGESNEVALRAFVDEHWLHVPMIDDKKVEIVEHTEMQVDVSGDPNRLFLDHEGPFYVPGVRIVFAAPFEGDAGFFDVQPNSYSSGGPAAEIVGNEVRVTYEVPGPPDFEAIKRDFTSTLSEIKQYLQRVLRQNSINLYFQQLRLSFIQTLFSISKFDLGLDGPLITVS